ncbi:acetylglutamate kinase [Bacteroidota bacterium]
MEKLYVIKIGGKVVEDDTGLPEFLEDFARVPGKKILVHGGGKWVTEMSRKLGIEVKMVDGRRITDSDTLEVVKMMLAGVANKNVVALLQGYGCNAIGMTGADGNMIRAHKRPLRSGIDYGFVGDIDEVNSAGFKDILKSGFVPVLTAMTHDGNGQLFNTNADTIAQSIGVAMAGDYEVEIFYCFEMPGVLTEIKRKDSLIEVITKSSYKELKEKGVIVEGMIPKIDNAYEALEHGVQKVHICHFNDIKKLASGTSNIGTVILE